MGTLYVTVRTIHDPEDTELLDWCDASLLSALLVRLLNRFHDYCLEVWDKVLRPIEDGEVSEDDERVWDHLREIRLKIDGEFLSWVEEFARKLIEYGYPAEADTCHYCAHLYVEVSPWDLLEVWIWLGEEVDEAPNMKLRIYTFSRELTLEEKVAVARYILPGVETRAWEEVTYLLRNGELEELKTRPIVKCL